MANKLTRGRKAPRIVKKNRNPKQHKNFNLGKLPKELKPHWDKHKTMAENFERTGLTLKQSCSFRQTKAGKKVMDQAQQVLYKAKYGEDAVVSDEEDAPMEKKIVDKIPLQTLFPEIKSDAEAPFRKTEGKLKWDEVRIVKACVQKYGKDNYKVS